MIVSTRRKKNKEKKQEEKQEEKREETIFDMNKLG